MGVGYDGGGAGMSVGCELGVGLGCGGWLGGGGVLFFQVCDDPFVDGACYGDDDNEQEGDDVAVVVHSV